MAVDRASVIEAEFFEHGRGRDHALGMFFDALGDFLESRRVLQNNLGRLFGRSIEAPRHQFRQVVIQRADRFRYRHVVIVQDHDYVFAADVVHRLERHAGSDRAVANDGNRLAF